MAVHTHTRPGDAGYRQLCIALVLTVAMMAAEIVVGLMSGSLALIADAGHMLTDASALCLSLFAAWMAARPATSGKTYGYYRTEILAALVNGVFLWLLVAWVGIRAISRLIDPEPVRSGPMFFVAVAGLCVNLACGWILYSGSKNNLNLRSAWLNVAADAVGSLGVIAAALAIHVKGYLPADALASLLIACLIGASSWVLVRQSVNILLEAVPRHLRTEVVDRALRDVPGVCELHDLHLWTITTGMDAMSGHVIVADMNRSTEILERMNRVLAERFGITHTTLQLEPRK